MRALTHAAAPWNRMRFAYLDELEAAVEAVAVDDRVRALLLTADGDQHFSVGMDLHERVTGSDARGSPKACSTSACACCARSSGPTSRPW